MKLTSLLFSLLAFAIYGQNYTSYFTGNTEDTISQPKGGVCLMGGATEHDEAMKWFLKQADGGDILVLRASGSDGYNDYLYSDLGIAVNSVETIVCHNAAASEESYVQERIAKAEAIWFAGGDQWNYISYWRNSPVATLINQGLSERKIVIGGTSAGMAIQGGFYFSAENGTVSSSSALANPYNSAVTVSNESFLQNDFLSDVITDTHYDNPDRKGRHAVFLSRIFEDFGMEGRGIACDEYTAVCMDSLGFCKLYGDYPNYDEDIYFIQVNCELSDPAPENCESGTPLTWKHSGQALKVYHAKGTMQGTQTFDLSDWQSGSGGVWENWYVENGQLFELADDSPDCGLGLKEIETLPVIQNPVELDFIDLSAFPGCVAKLYAGNGKLQETSLENNSLNISNLPTGVYFLQLQSQSQHFAYKLILKR